MQVLRGYDTFTHCVTLGPGGTTLRQTVEKPRPTRAESGNPWIRQRLQELQAAGDDVSQSGLADALGVARPRINELIDGPRRVAVGDLPVLARYLQLSIPAVLSLVAGVRLPESGTPGAVVVAVAALDSVAASLDALPAGEPGLIRATCRLLAARVRGLARQPTRASRQRQR